MNSDFQLNTIGASANSSGGARADFDTSELIFYTSDQTDNRFKIESNINNYYGLYNDANEMAEPWTSPDATVTNESKDGFTVTNPASGDYVAFELAIPAPHLTPSRIRVSFMADDPDDALNNISCRTSANGPSGSLLTINNGFNSIDINNNVGTGNTTTHLNIQFNAGTKTATLSNFKVSRISRNGFVETWYDQSGNGNHATQGIALSQPQIVANGGLLADGLNFDGTDDDLRSPSIGTYQSSDGHGGFAVYKKDTASTSDTFDSTNPMYLYQIGGSLNTTTQGMRILGGKLYSIQADTNGDASGFIDRASTTHTIGTSKTLSSIVGSNQMAIANNGTPLTVSGSESGDSFNSTSNTFIRIGSQTSASRFFDGSIEEVIIYTSDKTSDRTEIENDINNHYNIY
jgi:hypothetical protein